MGRSTKACWKKLGRRPDLELGGQLKKFKSVFKSEVPDALPPRRFADHEIEVEEESKPHIDIFIICHRRRKWLRKSIEDLLKKGKVRRIKFPYGAPLFSVKEMYELEGVVEYRAITKITIQNNSPIPKTDEMFDLVGFHQMRMNPDDIEKTAFNKRYGQLK